MTGCALLGPAAVDTPEGNFDVLWTGFDELYALFDVKGVDWEAQRDEWRPAAAAARDDSELQEAFMGLLTPLNDNHVTLLVPDSDFGAWKPGILQSLERDDFHTEVVRENYLRLEGEVGEDFFYGWVGEIGYLYVGSFSHDGFLAELDDAVALFSDAPGVIIDVRDNGGGLDRHVESLAARFFDVEADYARSRNRDGPEHDDFDDWLTNRVVPGGEYYGGPMVVLTHRYTISAAEWFVLAMQQRPDTTHVGDWTSGAFGAVIWRDMPNGWLYSVTGSDTRDMDDQSWEGIGLAPEIEAKSTLEDLNAGVDRGLEAALELF